MPLAEEGQIFAKRACLSCKEQRRKCDKSLPWCTRCTKAGRQCPGYAPDAPLSFVHYSAATGKRSDQEKDAEDVVNGSQNHVVMQMPHRERQTPEQLFETLIKHKDAGHVNGTVPHEFTQLMAPHRLHFTPGEFRQHFEALWASFLMIYSRTADYWPQGCSVLALRHEALDLALIALSAQHLAANESNANFRVLGLTAYDKSLKLFKSLMENPDNDNSNAVLAVISLVYFLIEVSQQLESVLSSALQYGWSAVAHFDGALALTNRSGPESFSGGGFHIVFKKIRELAVYTALLKHEKTFLSSPEWMTLPWQSQAKTWRDGLYDIAVRLSAELSGDESRAQDVGIADWGAAWPRHRLYNLMEIDRELAIWRHRWLRVVYPQLPVRCTNRCMRRSCICTANVSDIPNNEFVLLQVELWSLQLLIDLHLLQSSSFDTGLSGMWPERVALPGRADTICREIEQSFLLPLFKNNTQNFWGITEGLCRSILPSWALQEYKTFKIVQTHPSLV